MNEYLASRIAEIEEERKRFANANADIVAQAQSILAQYNAQMAAYLARIEELRMAMSALEKDKPPDSDPAD